ncbi:GspH/FimT family pseudopilin [Kangiella sp. TOML190]|uniref:GspH/FimT family pseudopilin n=1 Tax=Kangiella sp. TOML190 TaxID=2931351 RepID=UPI00203BD46B|nr:GspH/FimT family pseudopilin [Kangiella sp. TOML190]
MYQITANSKGFTLIELMVTVSIFSISTLFSLGFIGKLLEKNKVSADTMRLLSLISQARNSAISHNRDTYFCSINSEQDCQRQWQTVVVMTKDTQHNKILAQHQLKANYHNVNWSSFQRKAYLAFNSRGYSKHQNGTLYLCHDNYSDLSRAIVVSKSGRARIVKQSHALAQKCQKT